MAKPVLISGIQPSGKLHLGNYLGALKNFVELQNSGKYQCYFFIADYHSLTEEFNPQEKTGQILNLAADYLAIGLNPKKSTLFVQSQVPQSTELAWILDTLTPLGELGRMTQFKDKMEWSIKASIDVIDKNSEIISEKNKLPGGVNAGLLMYPTLMAADVLLYDAAFVPVGDDQLQHLELTRTLARKFESRFGKLFMEPKPLLTATPRIMSLDNPAKKMSKSMPKGCLFIDDSPAEIEAKIKTAVTDSGSEVKYDPQSKAAIANLMIIYKELSGKSLETIKKQFQGKGYGEFKKSLAGVVIEHFADFRKKKAALMQKPATIKTVLKSGSTKARKVAEKKMQEVRKKIGLI